MSKQINLFNPALLKQKAVFTTVTMARALGVLVLGLCALALYGQHKVSGLQQAADAGAEQLKQRKARQATVAVEFAARTKNANIEQQIAQAEAQVRALRDVEGVLRGGELGDTKGYAEYFKALARQSRGDLWLTGVSIQGAGQQIGLQGRALEPTLVPAYIGRLTREPIMQGKSFGSLQISQAVSKDEKPVPAPYIEFSLQSELADKPEAAQ